MTCQEKWNSVPDGSVVYFTRRRQAVLKLAKQLVRNVIFEHYCVPMGGALVGLIVHVSEEVSLSDEFIDQFKVLP